MGLLPSTMSARMRLERSLSTSSGSRLGENISNGPSAGTPLMPLSGARLGCASKRPRSGMKGAPKRKPPALPRLPVSVTSRRTR